LKKHPGGNSGLKPGPQPAANPTSKPLPAKKTDPSIGAIEQRGRDDTSVWSEEEIKSIVSEQRNLTEAQIGTIYLVRHAERDSNCPVCCLNETGWARAGKISNLFVQIMPKMIFAYNYNHYPLWIPALHTRRPACQRCYQTVLPTAVALGLAIDQQWPKPGNNKFCAKADAHCKYEADAGAAEAMKAALTSTNGGPILVAWESVNTNPLMMHLGVKNAPWWPYDSCTTDYNRMYRIKFTKIGDTWVVADNGDAYDKLTELMPCLANRMGAASAAANPPVKIRADYSYNLMHLQI
jgi:hypothetical protein